MTTPQDHAELERQARTGDAAAFGRLVRAWDRDLRGVAWAVLRSPTATDDVMQSAYERAFRSLHGFDGRSSMKTWLYSIVHRTAIDHVRYEGRRTHDDVDDIPTTADPGVRSSTESMVVDRVELARILDRCTPDQRTMLMLTAALGYSFDETAEIVGVSRGTVASRVSRIRQRLRNEEVDH